MILKSKICGASDSTTLQYIINHAYPSQFIGFIVNYPKSKRYVDLKKVKELVFGESIIPQETKEHGFAGLKNLGSKPLGDLIFTSKKFKRMRVLFAKFEFNNKKYWGRLTVFRVNGFPMSIKEIFIID